MSGINGPSVEHENLVGIQLGEPDVTELPDHLDVAVQSEQVMNLEGGGESTAHELARKVGSILMNKTFDLIDHLAVLHYRFERRHPKIVSLMGRIDKVLPFRRPAKAGPAFAIYEHSTQDHMLKTQNFSGPNVTGWRSSPHRDDVNE